MIPVFIGGCQRSGTTLLASIISANSKCCAIPEAPFKWGLLQKIEKNSKAEDLILWLQRQERFKIWNLDIKELKIGAPDLKNFMSALVTFYAKKNKRENTSFWIDHTTENLKYAYSLSKHFPEAKFIHIVRDGRAASASVMPLDWGPSDIVHAARWWVESLSYGIIAEQYLKANILQVHYEELLTNPDATIREICSFLDLNFEDNMLLANGFKVPGYTEGQHNLVGKQLDKSRLEAWKQQLSEEEIMIFEQKTGDILPLMGYSKLFNVYQNISKSGKVRMLLTRINRTFLLNPLKRKVRYWNSKK